MRCKSLTLVPTLLALFVLGRCSDEGLAAQKVFQAGAAAIDISPQELPISSNGSMRDRQPTKIHDPLHARAIVLDDGNNRLAIVVCDSCMIPREIFDAAKAKAAEATGISTSCMLTSATHTHTAVTVTGVFQSEVGPKEKRYIELLIGKIAKAVIEAEKAKQPAKIGWAVGSDPSQVFCRRWIMRPGTVNADPFGGKNDLARMNPGYKKLDLPAGPIDPEVPILSLVGKDGTPIALLANYSLHYVGGVPGGSLSADYFGEFARKIGQRIGAPPEFVGIMSNGTSGNINNIDYSAGSRPRRAPFEQIQLVAASVADAAYKAYRTIEYHDWVPLASRETEIELGVRKPSGDDLKRAAKLLDEAGPGPYSKRSEIYARESVLLAEYPETVKVKLQAHRIGDLAIVSTPCETFTQTGLAIKKHSPFKTTFTIELANGYNGYLPTAAQHRLGGYETWRARSSYLAVDAEQKIRMTIMELLGDLAPEK